MSPPNLIAEHAALTAERKELLDLIRQQWKSMDYGTAKGRADRLGAIHTRLAEIERSRQWQRRPGVGT